MYTIVGVYVTHTVHVYSRYIALYVCQQYTVIRLAPGHPGLK